MKRKLPTGSEIFVLSIEQEIYNRNDKSYRQLEALTKDGIHFIQKKYHPFGLKAMITWLGTLLGLSSLILTKKIKFIHSWCTPPGIFAYILSRIWGRKLILDSYEPHAESMVENMNWTTHSIAFKILFAFEKWMSKKASHVIGTTLGMKAYAKEKYCVDLNNFYVKPACVDIKQFNYNKAKREDLIMSLQLKDKFVMLYAGKFGGIYYDKEVFDYIKVATEYFGKERFRALILSNISEEQLSKYCNQARVDRSIIKLNFVSHTEIQDYMRLADFAICPVKPIPTKKYCTPIKNGEYWAMGLPVVITRNISDDSDIIYENNIGYVLRDTSDEEYLNACKHIDDLLKNDSLQEKIRKIATQYRDFAVAEDVYQNIYGKK